MPRLIECPGCDRETRHEKEERDGEEWWVCQACDNQTERVAE